MKGLVPSTVVKIALALIVLVGLISIFVYYGLGQFKIVKKCDQVKLCKCCCTEHGYNSTQECFDAFGCEGVCPSPIEEWCKENCP